MLTLLVVPHFLDIGTCQRLIERIEHNRQPSTILYGDGDPDFRTSETCYLAASEVSEVDRKIGELLGLSGGEPIQGQRYAVGQEFKPHTDTFEDDLQPQRTWTAMIYLNEVEGGETDFPLIGVSVRPQAGKLLAWDNLRDGKPNYSTLHHGTKVLRGTKYILTKWYRG